MTTKADLGHCVEALALAVAALLTPWSSLWLLTALTLMACGSIYRRWHAEHAERRACPTRD